MAEVESSQRAGTKVASCLLRRSHQANTYLHTPMGFIQPLTEGEAEAMTKNPQCDLTRLPELETETAESTTIV